MADAVGRHSHERLPLMAKLCYSRRPMGRILLLLSLVMLALGTSTSAHAAEVVGRAITADSAVSVSGVDQLAAQESVPQHQKGGCSGQCCHTHCGGCHGHSVGVAFASPDLPSQIVRALIPPVESGNFTPADRHISELRPPIA